MRRHLVPTALLLPVVLLLGACGGNSAAGAGSDVDGKGSLTLDVGDQKGGSEAILRAAGELKDLDYRIAWSTFTSGPPLLEAVNAEAVDIGGVGNTPPVFAAGAGSRIKVVAAWHGTSDGDAVLVPDGSKLTDPRQLRGKSVAVAQGSSAHYQLVASLKAAGLGIGDVKVKYLQPADALAAFTAGKVDAWAVWDPYTSQVLRSGRGRILTTGKGVTNGLSFQVASPSALADPRKAAAVKDYLARLRRATAWVYGHQREWAEVWAKDTGLPYEVALASVRRTNASRVAVAVDRPLVASEQQIADAFTALRLIPGKVDFGRFVDTRYNGDLPASTSAPRAVRGS
ncbi:ABC transporter substrate-binding protein [Streptomyces sp. DSM 41014]|uniref:ABC transporter substrate-binding protein n=1 Tax=Streptomyces hintoniae TaxID=3075521 RepID=A0ABU2UJY5_9ACTN|nr:ABC transporter substrate-binding protein [Streptomyces sp. DSM 41014]MDT0473187.1 ABC transporter substrate-binding protein [Streptomyces sp. DSM 41014]